VKHGLGCELSSKHFLHLNGGTLLVFRSTLQRGAASGARCHEQKSLSGIHAIDACRQGYDFHEGVLWVFCSPLYIACSRPTFIGVFSVIISELTSVCSVSAGRFLGKPRLQGLIVGTWIRANMDTPHAPEVHFRFLSPLSPCLREMRHSAVCGGLHSSFYLGSVNQEHVTNNCNDA